MKKILNSIAICFVVGLGFSSTSLANDGVDNIIQKPNSININKEVENLVTDEMLDYFDNEAKTKGNITIHNVQGIEKNKNILLTERLKPENEIQPLGLIYNYSVTFSNVRRTNSPAHFIISVAKGQTKTLSTTKSFSLTSGVTSVTSGSLPGAAKAEVESRLESTQSVSYNKTIKWSGPPETSKAVSRNYYITFFYDTGNFTVTRTTKLTGNKEYYRGTFREPSHYVEWSNDVY